MFKGWIIQCGTRFLHIKDNGVFEFLDTEKHATVLTDIENACKVLCNCVKQGYFPNLLMRFERLG